MDGAHFKTSAQLERQMDAARQLRAETLRSATRVALETALAVVRRVTRRIAFGSLRQA